MSTRRRGRGRGKAAAASQRPEAAEPDVQAALDASQAAEDDASAAAPAAAASVLQGAASSPGGGAGVAAIAAKAAGAVSGAVSRAIRSSTQGLLGLSGGGARREGSDGGGGPHAAGGGDDAAARSGRAPPEPPDLAAGFLRDQGPRPGAGIGDDLLDSPVKAAPPDWGLLPHAAAGAAAADEAPQLHAGGAFSTDPHAQQAAAGEGADHHPDGPLARWLAAAAEGSHGGSHADQLLAHAAAAAQSATRWLASRRALALLPLALLLLLVAQQAALSRQSRALAMHRRQLQAQSDSVAALRARLADVQGLLSTELGPSVKQAESQAGACAADVAAVAADQRALAARIDAWQGAAGAAAVAAGVSNRAPPTGGEGTAHGGAGSTGAAGMHSGASPLDAASSAALLAQAEALLDARVPAPDLALAACGATIKAHSPLAWGRLPWRMSLLRLLRALSGNRSARHPAADALVLSPRLLPGRCLPLRLPGPHGGPAFVDIALPGPANVSAVEVHMLLEPWQSAVGPAAVADGTQQAWVLLETAPRNLSVRLLNMTGPAAGVDSSSKRRGSSVGNRGAAAGEQWGPPDATFEVAEASLLRGPANRARVVLTVPAGGPSNGSGSRQGGWRAADGVRVEVASAQAAGAGVVCLGRVAVRGTPVGGGSFC